MRVLLIAPPGAGKGTQATRIAGRYGVTHVSSGDIFRAELEKGTPAGLEARAYVEAGDLVPDDVVLAVVAPYVLEAAQQGGYVLDGFPRTVSQAKAAHELAKERGVELHATLWLDAPDEELVKRLAGRAAAEGRSDDTEAVVAHRLAVYKEKTLPLVEYYEGRGILHHVDALGSMDEVSERVFAVLDPLRDAPDA